jgi:hypothetical protein
MQTRVQLADQRTVLVALPSSEDASPCRMPSGSALLTWQLQVACPFTPGFADGSKVCSLLVEQRHVLCVVSKMRLSLATI